MRDTVAVELLWWASRLRLGLGTVPATVAGAHVSAIVRPPAALAGSLASLAGELNAEEEGGHHVYPPGSIHVTVLNLDPWLGGPDAETRVLAAVRTVVTATPAFAVRAGGLAVSPSTVFVRVESSAGELGRLRRRLTAALGPPRAGRRWRHAVIGAVGLAFANVIRFRGPVAPALLRRARALRRAELGGFDVETVEIVRTDQVLSADATRVLARVSLGAALSGRPGSRPGGGPGGG